MKFKLKRVVCTLYFLAIAMFASSAFALAQDVEHADQPGKSSSDNPLMRPAPRCTMGAASGTYGYHMEGQILGVGPFLVNGLFTHHNDGAMDADVQLVVGPQSFPALGSDGSWKINDDCTGTGKFKVAALNLDVTYNFIATDGGNQIDLLNTNPGVLLHGVGRRIAKTGNAPSCNNGTILGSYGYRLGGSLPGVPYFIIAGVQTYKLDDNYKSIWTGTDTFNAMGQYLPRINSGTGTVNSNCRGTGFYSDNLGNKVNYVFTVVDGGDTIYVQGNEPGIAASGIATRIK